MPAQAPAHDGRHVVVQQSGIEQLADDDRQAARRLEFVHVRLAVRIHARQQRNHRRQVVEVIPRQQDAGGTRHRDQVQRVVGRAAGGQQADDAVDEGALVEHVGDRRVLLAAVDELEHLPRRFARQRLAQRCVRVDEGGARQVQAHDLHQHLVGVGGAVEGAGAGAVVRLGLGLQQVGARELAFGVALARARFLVVAHAGGHRAAGHEHGRQMAERQRADHQPRHDLVAHAQVQRRVEHLVRQRHGGGERNGVAREQRQLHAVLPLRHAIAHGRHAAGELGGAAGGQRGFLDPGREGLQRLVRRQHVVVRRDDADVGPLQRLQADLGLALHGREAVGEVGTRQQGPLDLAAGVLAGGFQIGLAGAAAAVDDALGDVAQYAVQGHAVLLVGQIDVIFLQKGRPWGSVFPDTQACAGIAEHANCVPPKAQPAYAGVESAGHAVAGAGSRPSCSGCSNTTK